LPIVGYVVAAREEGPVSDWESRAMDAAQDAYMEELYREHSEMAIQEFRSERLRSYYRNNPTLADHARRMLADARSLSDSHPGASLVLSASSVELAVKVLLLKPMVFGLVHVESAADLVAELVITHTGMERFRGLLFEIMAKHAGIDLSSYSRTSSPPTLWNEICLLQSRRNAVLHRGEIVIAEDAQIGIAIADTLLSRLFEALLEKLGLHSHDDGQVCEDPHEPSYP